MALIVGPVTGLVWTQLGCTPKPSALERADSNLPASSAATADEPSPRSTQEQPGRETSPASAGATPADPKVSTSRGEKGGVVVLWPRILPAAEAERTDGIARSVQKHLEAVAARTLPGRPIDLRPAPERTCPLAGCEAVAVGALLVREGGGCALVAFVMPPGTDRPTLLVPWSGSVDLNKTEIPFRAYPESEAKIRDFARCDGLALSVGDAAIGQAIQAAAR